MLGMTSLIYSSTLRGSDEIQLCKAYSASGAILVKKNELPFLNFSLNRKIGENMWYLSCIKMIIPRL